MRCYQRTLSHKALGFLAMLPMVASQPVQHGKTDSGMPLDTPTQPGNQLPSWALPPIFLAMLAYVELAGLYYKERRKWYLIAMGLSNMWFPWLVDHDSMSPTLTVCVFAFALRPTWAYAMIDYNELRPSPAFYTLMGIGGFGICATISALTQNATIPGMNAASGANPFSVYLLFSMTASMIACGRALAACKAWIRMQATTGDANAPPCD